MRRKPPSCSAERRWLAAIGLGGVLAAALACGCAAACDTSDEGNPSERFTGGSVACGAGGCEYASSGWHSAWLHFPGGKRYDFEHGLGTEPTDVGIYLSFSEDGIGRVDETDTAAPSAGNAGEMQLIDDRIVRVKNDTCAEFWVRVTARSLTASGVDAGSTDGAQESSAADAAQESSVADAAEDSSAADAAEEPSATDAAGADAGGQ